MKGSTRIPVAVHPLPVRIPDASRTPRRRCTRVGDGHDQVRFDRVSAASGSHLAPGLVQVPPLHVRVRARKSRSTRRRTAPASPPQTDVSRRAARLEDDHLAGPTSRTYSAPTISRPAVSDESTSRSWCRHPPATSPSPAHGIGSWQTAQDEWPEPERIAHADHPAFVEDHKGEGATNARQHTLERFHGVGRRLVG